MQLPAPHSSAAPAVPAGLCRLHMWHAGVRPCGGPSPSASPVGAAGLNMWQAAAKEPTLSLSAKMRLQWQCMCLHCLESSCAASGEYCRHFIVNGHSAFCSGLLTTAGLP